MITVQALTGDSWRSSTTSKPRTTRTAIGSPGSTEATASCRSSTTSDAIRPRVSIGARWSPGSCSPCYTVCAWSAFRSRWPYWARNPRITKGTLWAGESSSPGLPLLPWRPGEPYPTLSPWTRLSRSSSFTRWTNRTYSNEWKDGKESSCESSIVFIMSTNRQ